jgi:hypothetical protein
MIRYYNACVRSGRLVLDEPATDLPDLPEGTPIELVWIEDIRNGGDLFEAAEQAALERQLDASIAEADAGQTIDVAEALAALRTKPQEGFALQVTTVQRSMESGAILISSEDHALRNRHAQSFDNVRQLLARASALAHARVNLFKQAAPAEDGEARRRREIFAHLIQATAEAIDHALEAGDQLAAELVTRPAGTKTT